MGRIVLSFDPRVARRRRMWVLGPAMSSAETTVRRPKVFCGIMRRPKPKMVLLSLDLSVSVRLQDQDLESIWAQETNQDVGHFGRGAVYQSAAAPLDRNRGHRSMLESFVGCPKGL
jgi:hypothetical protein